MAENTELAPNDIVSFLRKRDYVFVRELGSGASGRTILLHDDVIDENIVCKKYHPHSESVRAVQFASFVREIKLLHQVHHPNVVRVFNYFIYPAQFTGYILMEHVD
jgi:serine/threonine protein kinase